MALWRWLPRTLVGRVFALYAATLAAFVGLGLALFVQHQYATELEAAADDAQTLFSVLVPVVTESAVIGDYDTIGRQIGRAARHSGVAEIVFVDNRGTPLVGRPTLAPRSAPAWLTALVARRLHDNSVPIAAGGTPYGQLTLRFAAGDIAYQLWREVLAAMMLAAMALAGGMLAIRAPLVRWLGQLDRIGDLDASLGGGRALARQALESDAPLEFRRTFEALDRAAANLASEREQAQAARAAVLANLRRVLERSALPEGVRASAQDDLEAVSQLVSRLVLRLEEHSAQLDAIFALSPDGFVSFDADRVVRYASPGFVRLTGLSPDMVLGVEEEVLLFRLRRRCHGWDRLEHMSQLRDAGAGEGQEPMRVQIRHPRHRVLALALHRSDSGAVAQVMHLRDITHESEVERMKSEFLSTAAHELRTPMATIYGFIELLQGREYPAERRREILGTIHRQCQVMIDLVNELLDLARIEARRDLDFHFEVHPLASLAAEAVAAFLPPGGRERPVLPEAPPPWPVRVDAAKFQQVVRNVLSNAYKYSPGGGAVRLRLLAPVAVGDAGLLRVGLQIEDGGIGMTPEQLARVGERFYRADASGNIPGTGLGMRLVMEVMGLMGGEVALRSTPGEGTTVTLWLPLSALPTELPEGVRPALAAPA